jgi:lipopolysaccharide/colanic/teichoic acid biosynthesis glycosyltransferase
MKRALDVAVAGVGLLVLAPVLTIATLLIFTTTGPPVLFRQRRLGLDFRPFEIVKLRTMTTAPGPAVSTSLDPRITRIGAWLRRTKIDEFPQLWNVLRGDMSLVGPRPEIPHYVDQFREDYAVILTVRPGITDEASLRYRNEEALLAAADDPEGAYVEHILPEKLALARAYVADRSLRGDIAIMLRTLFKHPGADRCAAVL